MRNRPSILCCCWWWWVVLVLSFVRAAPAPSDTAVVVARCAGRTITLAEFRHAYLDVLKNPSQFDSPQRRSAFLDELIATRLLAAAAETTDAAHEEHLLRSVEAYRGTALRSEHFAAVIRPLITVEEKDVEEAYRFTQEQRHVSHLFFSRKSAADSAYDALLHGAAWDSIAARLFTDSALASSGGDLGWVEWDQMEYPLAMAAFRQLPDAFSPPLRSSFGYHIIMVKDFKKHPLLTRQQYAERKRKTRYLLENKIGDMLAYGYIDRMLHAADVRLMPATLRFVEEKLAHQFTRRPVPADAMSELQLRDAEVRSLETTLWDARNETMALIDGVPMTVGDFLGCLRYIPYGIVHSGFHRSFDAAVRDMLLIREAVSKGLDSTGTVRMKVRLYREYLLSNAFRSRLVSAVTVSDRDVRRYFDKNKGSYPHMTFEQARTFFTETVLNERRQQAVSVFVRSALRGAPVERRLDIIDSVYQRISAKDGGPDAAFPSQHSIHPTP